MLLSPPQRRSCALQVVENKVHAFVSTHGPKLREISRQVQLGPPNGARPISSPAAHHAQTPSSYRRGTSAPSKVHSPHNDNLQMGSAPVPHARIPGKLLSVEESARIDSPDRPYTAGAAVQSPHLKSRPDWIIHAPAENTSPQRRVRCAGKYLLSVQYASHCVRLSCCNDWSWSGWESSQSL